MAEIRYIDAINQAHHEEMARDERVIIMGEDVGRKGGVFGATMGLLASRKCCPSVMSSAKFTRPLT